MVSRKYFTLREKLFGFYVLVKSIRDREDHFRILADDNKEYFLEKLPNLDNFIDIQCFEFSGRKYASTLDELFDYYRRRHPVSCDSKKYLSLRFDYNFEDTFLITALS